MLSNLLFCKSSIEFLVLSIVSFIAKIAFPPVSSHILPKSWTPNLFCLIGSFTSLSPVITFPKASFALFPPLPNAFVVSSTSSPRALNASFAVPSLTFIEKSFMASPSLSMSNTPASAPFFSMLNISVAERPIC